MTKFSAALGVSTDSVRTVEYQRGPLGILLGMRVCVRFNVNQRWLASGESPETPAFEIATPIADAIPGTMLFSTVFDRYLRDYFSRDIELLTRSKIFVSVKRNATVSDITTILERRLWEAYENSSPKIFRKLLSQLEALFGDFTPAERAIAQIVISAQAGAKDAAIAREIARMKEMLEVG